MYVELHARTAFSFLRGASFPEHLWNRLVTRFAGGRVCDPTDFMAHPAFPKQREQDCDRLSDELTMSDGAVCRCWWK
jgi:hypothetical protein